MGRVVILSSDTGEGHNSTAAALAAAAGRLGVDAEVRHPVEEAGGISDLMSRFYNTLLTHRPDWIQHYFRLIDWAKPNVIGYRLFRSHIPAFLARAKPGMILSVHPMLNYAIPRFIREAGLRIPFASFITDPFPPFWKGWVSPYVDRYLVPTEAAREALLRMGAAPDRVELVRMPVRPGFEPAGPEDIRAVQHELNLDQSSTILINGGARGGGPILEIYRTIRDSWHGGSIVVVCGHNDELAREVRSEADARTRVLGFRQDIHRFVNTADLVLTKPGALSTYEALACRVPVGLLGIGGVMPQESGLFREVAKQGAGYGIRTLDDLRQLLVEGPEAWAGKRPAIDRFYRPGFGHDIIERIQPLNV